MMEDFRRQFLTETVEKLENLRRTLRRGENFSQTFKYEIFRLLHTIKGTAQTFGFDAASRLAHELETRLADEANERGLMLADITNLQKSLTEETFQSPPKFIQTLDVHQLPSDSPSNFKPPEMAADYYDQLSNREKKSVGAAIRGGKRLTVLEIEFETGDFARKLVNFKSVLSSAGEIIAVFSGAKLGGDGVIGFRFLTASAENIETLARANSAAVLWSFAPPTPANGTGEILRQIVKHGAELAERLRKRIEFKTSGEEINTSSAEQRLVFEVLLHLVRNAADHAIERAGEIEIRIKEEANGLRLTVADDGRGIDRERVKTLATIKNPVFAVENMSESETINLIFQPEFSTKTETNEVSGRGIGLSAVKCAVEKAGGTISVATEKGKGTTFEIFLPRG